MCSVFRTLRLEEAPSSRLHVTTPQTWTSALRPPSHNRRRLHHYSLTLRERERFLPSGLATFPGRKARQPTRHIAHVVRILFRMAAGERRLFVQADEEIEAEEHQDRFDHQAPV